MSDRSRPAGRRHPPHDAERILADARRALFVMAGILAFIWLLQLVNWLDHYGLSRHFGIVAREPSRLPDIVSAPFLHWSFTHIEANSAPLFFLGFLAAYRGMARFLAVSAVVVVTSGIGSWAFDSAHSVGAGASGVIFGYFSYVVLRGVLERHVVDVIVGVVVAVSYWSILRGVLPSDPHISWQAHLFGLIGGIIAAMAVRQRSARRRSVRPAVGTSETSSAPSQAGAAPAQSRSALHQELHDLGLD
jgi:membrane associated rhomboid family serine protease